MTQTLIIESGIEDAATTLLPTYNQLIPGLISPLLRKYSDNFNDIVTTGADLTGRALQVAPTATTWSVPDVSGSVRNKVITQPGYAINNSTVGYAQCNFLTSQANHEIAAEYECGSTGSIGLIGRYDPTLGMVLLVCSSSACTLFVRGPNGNPALGATLESYTALPIDLTAGVKHKLRMVLNESLCTVYADDAQLFSQTLTNPMTSNLKVGAYMNVSNHKLLNIMAGW